MSDAVEYGAGVSMAVGTNIAQARMQNVQRSIPQIFVWPSWKAWWISLLLAERSVPVLMALFHQMHVMRGIHAVMQELASIASGCFRDDTTGQILVDSLIEHARQVGVDYVEQKQVWELRDRVECFQRTGRPPGAVRWVDVIQGGDIHTNYRSRPVTRQMRTQVIESISAGTPPL